MKTLFSFLISIAIASNTSFAQKKDPGIDSTIDSITAADGKAPYGIFDVTSPDGQVYREVISADGTFSNTAKNGSVIEGVWQQREAGIFCSKPFRAPSFRCKYEKVNSDGVWTSKEIAEGEVSTIRRLEK